MHTLEPGARRLGCLACGQPIRRIPRALADRDGTLAGAQRRYACRDTACGWQGLLPRQPTRDRFRAWARRLHLLPTWGLTALLALPALAIATFLARGGATRLDWSPPAAWAPGAHSEGVPVAAAHPMAHRDRAADAVRPEVERLQLRQGCAWGTPGRNPYRGTVAQALLTARLPREVVERIERKVESRQVDDRLVISTAGIRTERDRRVFEPRNVALSYGRTLCVNSRVNFPAGHVERASLYEAADRDGRLYSVMVPDVCGNVSVIAARMERRRRPAAASMADGAVPPVLVLVAADGEDPPAAAVGAAVPEPPSWAAAAAAFIGWGVAALLRRRRAPARDEQA